MSVPGLSNRLKWLYVTYIAARSARPRPDPGDSDEPVPRASRPFPFFSLPLLPSFPAPKSRRGESHRPLRPTLLPATICTPSRTMWMGKAVAWADLNGDGNLRSLVTPGSSGGHRRLPVGHVSLQRRRLGRLHGGHDRRGESGRRVQRRRRLGRLQRRRQAGNSVDRS